MKQFDLKEYLKDPNKKVVTRDGRNVRIICTDRRADEEEGGRPIVALVNNHASEELILCYKDGKHFCNSNSEEDLFFKPKTQTGWLNLYKDEKGRVAIGTVYPIEFEEKAMMASEDKDYVATCKITWEE